MEPVVVRVPTAAFSSLRRILSGGARSVGKTSLKLFNQGISGWLLSLRAKMGAAFILELPIASMLARSTKSEELPAVSSKWEAHSAMSFDVMLGLKRQDTRSGQPVNDCRCREAGDSVS